MTGPFRRDFFAAAPAEIRRAARDGRIDADDAPDDEPGEASAEELAGLFRDWSLSFGRFQRLTRAANAFARRERLRPGSLMGRVFAALDSGEVDRARGLAGEALRFEAEPALREVLRALAATAVAVFERDKASAFFEAEAGWRPGEPLCAASALLYVALGKAWRPWEDALAAGLSRGPEASRRLAALSARFDIAGRAGLDRAKGRRLFAALIAEPATRIDLCRQAASLIWAFGLDGAAQPFFGRFGGLMDAAEEDPVLARLLAKRAWHLVPSGRRARIRACAGRLEAVDRDTADFWRKASDPRLRVAVVGNSPCELGRGRGGEIDGHDLVARFNRAPEGGAFAADYGARCDAKMFAVRHVVAGRAQTGAPVVVMRQLPAVVDRLAFAAELASAGKRLVYLPTRTTAALHPRLGVQPSSGLAFLAQLRSLRGSLANVSCYGFDLTDQIAPDASSSHYFNVAQPGGHAWREERKLFDAWIGAR